MAEQHNKDGAPSSASYVAEADIGRTLRRAREGRGLTIADVAKQLRIDQRHIEAVESDSYDKVSGSVFVRGYLRNYARLLDLDPAPLIAAFDRSGQSHEPKMARVGYMPDMPKYRARSGGAKKVGLGVGAVVLLLVALWFARGMFEWMGEVASEQPTAETESNGSALSLPGMALFDRDAAQDAGAAPASGTMELALPPMKTPESAGTGVDGGGATAAATAPAASSASVESPARATLGLEFARATFVKVVDAENKALFAQSGKAGEKRWVTGVAPFTVTLASPRDVSIQVNGQAVALPASASKSNAVVVVGVDGAR